MTACRSHRRAWLRAARLAAAAACFALAPAGAAAQQVPDRDYRPPVVSPAYAAGSGPVVCVDEAHRNFHTMDNRFWAFAELLRRDGYRVQALASVFRASTLGACRVLVIANAAAPFETGEIATVEAWVASGGSLLLIADHRPYGAVAAPLAVVFGVRFTDGYAVDGYLPETRQVTRPGPTFFRVADGSLRPHPIVTGRSAAESIEAVRTFTGQAFQGPASLEPLLVFRRGFVLLPDRPAQVPPGAAIIDIEGWLQGGVMGYRAGRAAFFGEAAMFSAQRAGPSRQPMGMNAPGADGNFRFVLNVLHWLTN